MSALLKLDWDMETTTCCVCSTRFGVDKIIMDNRRLNAGHIFCPNGHQIGWSESSADRLRKQLEQEQQRVALERSMRITAENQLAAAQRAAKKVAKRINAGVCPKCNRTFQQLARHMQCKHAKDAS